MNCTSGVILEKKLNMSGLLDVPKYCVAELPSRLDCQETFFSIVYFYKKKKIKTKTKSLIEILRN